MIERKEESYRLWLTSFRFLSSFLKEKKKTVLLPA